MIDDHPTEPSQPHTGPQRGSPLRRRALLALALCGLAAIALVARFGGPGRARPSDPLPAGAAPTDTAADAREPGPMPSGPRDGAQPTTADRRAAPSFTEPGTAAGDRDAPQGLTGRVVDSTGAPVDGAVLLLVEGPGRGLLTTALLASRGVLVPPVARATSAADGRFRIPVRDLVGGLRADFELRVTHPRFAERLLGGLQLGTGAWIDIGDIDLPPGLELVGRVTIQGRSDFPIPDALVVAEPAGVVPTLTPTSGGAGALTARSDAAGYYRITNVGPGIVRLTAVADGFARVQRSGLTIAPGQDNRCDLELPRGFVITGTVRSTAGRPLDGARVEARAIGERVAAGATALSDPDGHFRLIGLIDADWQLAVTATDHAPAERTPVPAGATDVDVQLAPLPVVAIRALGDGAPLERYDVVLRAWHGSDESYGTVPTARVARVRDRDLAPDGTLLYGGVAPGRYVFQVGAAGYADTFSAPFVVEADAAGVAPQTIEVRMTHGGALDGRVLDAAGRALSGARVEALPGEFLDTPFARAFQDLVVHRATRAGATTGADGRFRIGTLTAASYRLRVSHPDHADAHVAALRVTDTAVTTTGPIRLQRGTLLHGTATVGGAPAGQVRVIVRSAAQPLRGDEPPIWFEAVTDPDGRFALPVRLPPGDYVAEACRIKLPGPLLQVADRERSKQEFRLAANEESCELHLQLPDT
ncbi:MAG: carboxypeptidase regulatory-like domain-containing protein [Planctomycetes bacterium]|nr:carboxypeptidase regulatory-like domain-containing protein [Planctomycetota bacterium]